MKRLRQNRHTVSGLFIFLLLGIFAVSSTVMVLIGAQAYKGSADRTAEHNADRIAAAYLRSKLREADDREMLRAEDLDGADMLRITNSEEGTVTMLYVYDGTLYEWYTLADLAESFDPGAAGDESALPDSGADADESALPDPGAAADESALPDPGADAGGNAAPTEASRKWIPGESICNLDEMRFSVSGGLITVGLRYGEEWTTVDYAMRSLMN